ncbi:uncharacterized protein TRIADDRAFT_31909 [Trichoplax adhaerens]|uniref:Major facilitator superfamily (MFS) profile domain-containing protein n=1 Tax=Trichoplax adhaerens TaxID=10228 RepID=B3S9Z7_TRIAD|nr:hypothetical protein TRIADDRAFT_31909 [Trichoplax adhaerens]EDV20423.1 hypothetical protein TRIADDRAFT_31909 [Trichoplax adhaerens]|eukprot:XP_002117117.1 hypothetical protein TRIADDRAFT_31909 [Trichoplax adhaerens]
MSKEKLSRGIAQQILVTLIACIANVNFGFATQYSSQATPQLQNKLLGDRYLTNLDVSLFGSLFSVGGIIGGIIGSLFLRYLGRRSTLVVCSAPFVLGWCFIMYGPNKIYLIIGRTFTGIGAILAAMAAPIYVAETCSPSIRGRLVSATFLAAICGNFLCVLFSLILNWNYLALVSVVLLTILSIAMAFLPETPRWLLSQGRTYQAFYALKWLRGDDQDIRPELQAIDQSLNDNQKLKCSELRQPAVLKPLMISIMLMILQQTSGINIFIFYGVSIIQRTGISAGYEISVILVGGLLLSTISTLYTVDYFGRRKMLITSGLGMAVGHFCFGIYHLMVISEAAGDLRWLAVATVAIILVSFGLGWGAVPFLSMSELLPIRIRSVGSGLAMIANWLTAFIVTYFYDKMTKTMEIYGTFWLYAVFSIIAVIYVYYALPETKGKSLEEIEAYFRLNKRVYNSEEEMELSPKD